MATENSQKNVVLLVLDSLRKDRVSEYNGDIDFTDNIDEIAGEATTYLNANAQAPWSLPSHASMFTGQYPWEHEATQRNIRLETEKKLLAEKFSDSGYVTAMISPNPWLTGPKGTVKGFSQVENFIGVRKWRPIKWIMEKGHSLYNKLGKQERELISSLNFTVVDKLVDSTKPERTVSKTRKFLQDVDDERFFLFVNLMSAHEPYTPGNPPKEYLEKHGVYDTEDVPKTEREYLNSDKDLEKTKKAYNAAADYTDDLVGEIYGCIQDKNLEDDTVLVITADHGQALGEGGAFTHAFSVKESLIDIPLVIRQPEGESKAKEEIFELRQLYNLLPKLACISDEEVKQLEFAKGGYEYPELMAGMIPEEEKDRLYRKFLYVKNSSSKIVKTVDSDDQVSYEMINLEDEKDIKLDQKMRKKIDEIDDIKESGSLEVEDQEIKERLENLGYM